MNCPQCHHNKTTRLAHLLAFTLFTVVVMRIGFAQTDADWKLYGAASIGGTVWCFYDANGLVREPGNQIRVWTKCLPGVDDKKPTDEMVNDAAYKIMHGYVPPIVVVAGMMLGQVSDVVSYEEIANLGDIEPKGRIFYEIGCPERMIRELSIDIRTKDKFGSSDTPSEWKHVAPETNADHLLKILCAK